MSNINSEDPASYEAKVDPATHGPHIMVTNGDYEGVIIEEAIRILERRLSAKRESDLEFLDPGVTRQFLRLKLATHRNEVFSVLFLDNQHRLIKYEEMFYGTIDGASVHPRVVAQRALELNTSAIILAHNHPSGVANPSQADIRLTDRIKSAMLLLDIRVLDHMVVGEGDIVSMAGRGFI